MPGPVPSRPLLRIAVAAIGILAGLTGVQIVAARVGADTHLDRGSGALTVAGTTYGFIPTACTISDRDFVVAGTGLEGADQFWISASSGSLDLSVGTDSKAEQPDDDQLWLVSDEIIGWRADGQSIVARARMADRRMPDGDSVLAVLEVRCENDV